MKSANCRRRSVRAGQLAASISSSAAIASRRSRSARSRAAASPSTRHVGRLVLLRILARGLAQHLGRSPRHPVRRRRSGTPARLHRPYSIERRKHGRVDAGHTARPCRTAALSNAPVFFRCMGSSSTMLSERPVESRSIACPPHMPVGADRVRQLTHQLRAQRRSARRVGEHLETLRPAAHRRQASRWPRRTRTCTVGLPRRRTSLSMHGISSWTANRHGRTRPQARHCRARRRRRPPGRSDRPRTRASGRTRLPPSSTA